MSATTAPTAGAPADAPRAAPIPRLVSAFSGTVGVAVKLIALGLSNALAVWAIYVLITRQHWVALAVLAAATVLIDLVYLAPGQAFLPAKFLIPGTIFLIGFQVFPIIYTVNIAFTDYTHLITAIRRGLRQIQYRATIVDGCLLGTGLTTSPNDITH